MAGFMHLFCSYLQHNFFAPPMPVFTGIGRSISQVCMAFVPAADACFHKFFHTIFISPVVQKLRRFYCLITRINIKAMRLVCTDQCFIFIKAKPFLVIVLYNIFQLL